MTLSEMAAEVEQVNRDHGWYDDSRTFGDLISLLHSEVSEALEAYRDRGFDKWYSHKIPDALGGYRLMHIRPDQVKGFKLAWQIDPKPEGVAAELADVLIRLLDMTKRYEIDLDAAVEAHYGSYGINVNFGDEIKGLHMHISQLAFVAEVGWLDGLNSLDHYYAAIYVYLKQMAAHNGIDLYAAYREKVDHNKIREYRHGGKKL